MLENQAYNTQSGRLDVITHDGSYAEIVPLIEDIIIDVELGRTTPEAGLQQALKILPADLATTVHENALLNPRGKLQWLLAEARKRKMALVVAGGVLNAASALATIASYMAPSNPPAQTIIVNNTTNIYPPAARDEGHGTSPDTLKREPDRLSEVQRPKANLKGKGQGKAAKKSARKPRHQHKP